MGYEFPVAQKFKVGDHVGLPAIAAVGKVLDRRNVLGGDDGHGRYMVEFNGVDEATHRILITRAMACSCRAHDRLLKKVGRRKFELERDFPALVTEAEDNCESKHSGNRSQIWCRSNILVNCTGKRRLPLNTTVVTALPPYVDLKPMGTWEPQ